MKNGVTQKILTILAIAGIIAAAVVLVIAYVNMFKQLKGKTSQQTPAVASFPSEQTTPIVAVRVEAQVGAIIDLITQPDGTVKLTIDSKPTGQKTYQLPSNQQVKFYTSSTDSTSIPISQLKKGTIVNVIKFPSPEHYIITGVNDATLIEKLL